MACNYHHHHRHHHHHSGLVGDVAVPVSTRQVVLSCAFLNPDARQVERTQVCLHRSQPGMSRTT